MSNYSRNAATALPDNQLVFGTDTITETVGGIEKTRVILGRDALGKLVVAKESGGEVNLTAVEVKNSLTALEDTNFVTDAQLEILNGVASSIAGVQANVNNLYVPLQKGAKTVRVSVGVDISTNADFNNIVILGNGHTPYLHEVSDSSYIGSTISYFSSGPTELTFQNGETTVRGNLKINQWQGVTATCVAVGAEDATVWYLIGGSPS